MSELSVWDLDGTMREGSLLADAILFGIQQGFMDPARYTNPIQLSRQDIDNFVADITGRSRHDFNRFMEQLSEEAPAQAMPWALERLNEQRRNGEVVVISHSPDFLVKAFCRGLNIHTTKGTYFHTQSHVFSGRAVLRDKGQTLAQHMQRTGILRPSFAAGDTLQDLPMLTQAMHAVVVNPDEDLAALALQNNWEIIRTRAITV